MAAERDIGGTQLQEDNSAAEGSGSQSQADGIWICGGIPTHVEVDRALLQLWAAGAFEALLPERDCEKPCSGCVTCVSYCSCIGIYFVVAI